VQSNRRSGSSTFRQVVAPNRRATVVDQELAALRARVLDVER
jgi:hypothetical protein